MRIIRNFRFYLSAGHLGLCGLLAVGLLGLSLTGPVLAQVCNPADFDLTSQAAVDAFPSGCTEVSGDLTIGPSSDITDLSPLSSLTSVGGSLHINFNAALTNVDGLSSLTTVGRNLFIGFNDTLTNVDGLSSLTTVGDDLDIEDNAVLSMCSCGLAPLLESDGVGGSVFMSGNAPAGDCNNDGADISSANCPPGPTSCPDDVLISNYQTEPSGNQFVEVANVGSGTISLDSCSLVTFNVLTETSIGDATVDLDGITLPPGDTVQVAIFGAPAGPGAIGIYDSPAPPDGTPFTTDNEITGMVYLDNETVFGISHLTVPAHNTIYECIYGGSGQGPWTERNPLGTCFP